jgi:hypothetical protein
MHSRRYWYVFLTKSKVKRINLHRLIGDVIGILHLLWE